MHYTQTAKNYAQSVVCGDIPACRELIAVCTRALNDWENPPEGCEYREEKAHRFLTFFESLSHVKGDKALDDLTFKAEPWQCFKFCMLYGWYRGISRRYQTVFLFVGKKNGKSSGASACALYGLVDDDEAGPEVYTAASKREQAKIVYDIARAIAEKSGLLDRYQIESHKYETRCALNSGVMRALSREAGKTGDGVNPSVVIYDEIHAHKNLDTWYVLQTAMAARRSPFFYCTTTAGDDAPNNPGLIKWREACAIANGAAVDDSFLPLIYQLDSIDEIERPDMWVKANPNIGVSVHADKLQQALVSAKNTRENLFAVLTKNFNVWSPAATSFIDGDKADAIPRDGAAHGPCVLSVDYAASFDPACVTVAYASGHYVPHNFLTREMVKKQPSIPWSEFDDGTTTILDAPSIAGDVIEEKVRELANLHKPEAVLYDPYGFTASAGNLAKKGLKMVQFKQTFYNLSEPCKAFRDDVHSGAVSSPSKLFALQCKALHVVWKDRDRGLLLPCKPPNGMKIDGVVSAIMGKGYFLHKAAKEAEEKAAAEARRIDVNNALAERYKNV